MIELFHQVREGKLKLDDPAYHQERVSRLVDASIYTLDARRFGSGSIQSH